MKSYNEIAESYNEMGKGVETIGLDRLLEVLLGG